MLDFARMVKTAVARRIAYLLVAGVFAAFLSMCGTGKAHAQDPYATCYENSVQSQMCPDREVAYAQAKRVSLILAGNTFVGFNTPSCNQTTHICTVTADGLRTNGSHYYAARAYMDSAQCPSGRQWDEATSTCEKNCNLEANSIASGWTLSEAGIAGLGICVDECAYVKNNAISITRVVDGVTYYSVAGWTLDTETPGCPAGRNDIVFPPADGDNDGVSDGNDPSPNNPGDSGNNGPNAPDGDSNDDGDGSGNGNKSSGGGSCQGAPSSSGDAILAQIAYQTWATRCAIENMKGTGGGMKVEGGGGTPVSVTTSGGTGGTGGGTQPEQTRDLLEAIKSNTKKGEGSGGGCTPEGSIMGFACSGDPVGCIQAEKAAMLNCREQAKDSDGDGQPDWSQGDEPDIPGDGDDDYEEPEFGVNIGPSALDTDNIFGGGTCPSFSINIMGHVATSNDIPYWCVLVQIMHAAVLVMGAYTALQILMGKF